MSDRPPRPGDIGLVLLSIVLAVPVIVFVYARLVIGSAVRRRRRHP